MKNPQSPETTRLGIADSQSSPPGTRRPPLSPQGGQPLGTLEQVSGHSGGSWGGRILSTPPLLPDALLARGWGSVAGLGGRALAEHVQGSGFKQEVPQNTTIGDSPKVAAVPAP